jgi:hypothetical protein
LWGFANFVAGAVLLHFFRPRGWTGWIAVGAGALLLSLQMAAHFGRVRAGEHSR